MLNPFGASVYGNGVLGGDRPVEVKDDALSVGQAHLLADDVAQRALDLGECDLGGYPGVVGRQAQRRGDVALVNPEIEHPDRQELPVGARSDRRKRRTLHIGLRQRVQIAPAAGEDRANLIQIPRPVQTRGPRQELPGTLERRHRRSILGQPPGQHCLDTGQVVDHPAHRPLRAQRLHRPLRLIQTGAQPLHRGVTAVQRGAKLLNATRRRA